MQIIKISNQPCCQNHIATLTYLNKRLVAAFVVACVIVRIEGLMWIMCVILEDPLTEMPQYIIVTCGMCGVISRTDFLVLGGDWGSAKQEFVFYYARGLSYFTDKHMHAETCTDVDSKPRHAHKQTQTAICIEFSLSLSL